MSFLFGSLLPWWSRKLAYLLPEMIPYKYGENHHQCLFFVGDFFKNKNLVLFFFLTKGKRCITKTSKRSPILVFLSGIYNTTIFDGIQCINVCMIVSHFFKWLSNNTFILNSLFFFLDTSGKMKNLNIYSPLKSVTKPWGFELKYSLSKYYFFHLF